jgi:hypothetical protein
MQEGTWSRRDYITSWLSQDAVAPCKLGRQTVIEIDSNSVRTESMTLRIRHALFAQQRRLERAEPSLRFVCVMRDNEARDSPQSSRRRP